MCVSYVVDHQVHDGFGDQVPDCAVDDGQVRVHQIPDDLHLSLQLRIQTVDLAVRVRVLCLRLQTHTPLNTHTHMRGTLWSDSHLLLVLQVVPWEKERLVQTVICK